MEAFAIHVDQPTSAAKLATALAAAAGRLDVDPNDPDVAALVAGAVALAAHANEPVRVSLYKQGAHFSVNVSLVRE